MTLSARPHRIGHPSPLLFHLGAALTGYQAAVAAAPKCCDPEFPWHPDVVRPDPPAPDHLAVAHLAFSRLRATEEGIAAWQSHPYCRQQPDVPVIWSSGSSRLLDYAPDNISAPVVLVVPSLINRAYILDLDQDCSFLRYLAASGLRPILMDWGPPGFDEAQFDLDAYVTARLFPAAAFLYGQSGRPPSLLGYCMGGALATALAARMQVGALITIGAPWSFSTGTGIAGEILKLIRQAGPSTMQANLTAMCEAFGLVPDWVIQQLFALVKPFDAARKFQKFRRMDPDSPEARRFVVLEDWLADSISMAGPAARDLLIDWHLLDRLAGGQWSVMGRVVRACDVAAPALVISGRRDTIAPPASSAPLAAALPKAKLLQPDLGHVGMIVGRQAETKVWSEVVAFLNADH